MVIQKYSDDEVLRQLGARLQSARLASNLTQAELADRVGVAQKTISNAEDGRNVSIETLIRMLRGLGRLADIDAVLAEAGPGPVEIAKRQGKIRQRATGSRGRRAAARSGWEW